MLVLFGDGHFYFGRPDFVNYLLFLAACLTTYDLNFCFFVRKITFFLTVEKWMTELPI